MDATTRRLAQYACDADIRRMPPQALHEARRRLIDSVACAAAAYPEPFCASIRAVAGRYAGRPGARVWGSGEATSMEMAAFANGTMVRYLDYSDTCLGKAAGHPSDMIAGLVAVAEAHGCDGAALVTAIIVAYEIYCGLCEAVAIQSRGVDQATCAAVGTAAGAARLLALSMEQTGNAISLALGSGVQLYNVRTGSLSDWKGCAGPNGARNGVFAALLARDGVTGPTAIVEGKGGLQEVVGPFDWQAGAQALPLIVGTHLKFHPVCYHGQSAIDAVLALRDAVPLDRIAAVEVETYESAYRAMGSDAARWAPTTRETADHSLPYTIACALQDGQLRSDAYADTRLADPSLKRIMDKIRVTSSAQMSAEFPARAQTRVTIRCTDGAEHTHLQENPKGNAANPLSDGELEAKFIELYAPWGDEKATRSTLETLWAVDRLPAVSTLVDALCSAR
ncbi:MAG TPA: MmgE/PrpD family protein [Ramlibacter sp.]|nr:MmgE/PrpD family protein [Ramlibacter sp.]